MNQQEKVAKIMKATRERDELQVEGKTRLSVYTIDDNTYITVDGGIAGGVGARMNTEQLEGLIAILQRRLLEAKGGEDE